MRHFYILFIIGLFTSLATSLDTTQLQWQDLQKELERDVVENVEFLLWTNHNPFTETIIKYDDSLPEVLHNSHFDENLPTKVIVHGYDGSGRQEWVINVKDAYLITGEYNVISVAWENLCKSPRYFYAVNNTRAVGYLAADMISYLVNTYENVTTESVHPIGMSLGAHVVGHLGYHLNGSLSRITGLDPAGPMFHTVPLSDRLSKDDAIFVDVIHCAGLWVGMDEKVGDVDFYPNGGQGPQPGCDPKDIGLSCSHMRCPDLFTESIISSTGFMALQCESWDEYQDGNCDSNPSNMMGDPASNNVLGDLYLKTNDEYPYAILNGN